MSTLNATPLTTNKFILINGPSRVGKDTLAHHLVQECNSIHDKLSAPLKMALKAMFNVGNNTIETYKDISSDLFLEATARELQIAMFDMLQDKGGDSVLADMYVTKFSGKAQTAPEIFVISDLGRQEELNSFIDAFGVDNIMVIRVFSPLHAGEFVSKDSRRYAEKDTVEGLEVLDLINNGKQEFLHVGLENVFNWLKR